jgi:hypothetical protein
MEHTREKINPELLTYFYKEHLDIYFEKKELDTIGYTYKFTDPNFLVDPNTTIPFPIDVTDLVRLHKLVRERKVFTILEYGLGYSTMIMADALYKNKLEFESCEDSIKSIIRCNNMFELHTVDNDRYWISHLRKRIEQFTNIHNIIHIHYSTCTTGTFNSRICHFYDQHPNIVPDFIYVDGPAACSVKGHYNGIDFTCLDRTVMSGDLLVQEPTFIPGLFIIIDGRTNNAYFLKNNLQRKYDYNYNLENDVHTFELQDKPLGKHNIAKLEYCGITTIYNESL